MGPLATGTKGGMEGDLGGGHKEWRRDGDRGHRRALDTVVSLHLRKIKEKSPTPWYNEHTRALKRAAQKIEHSWRKKKLEVFHMAWWESTLSYRKALKTARSDYFSYLLEENKHNPRYLINTVAKVTKK